MIENLDHVIQRDLQHRCEMLRLSNVQSRRAAVFFHFATACSISSAQRSLNSAATALIDFGRRLRSELSHHAKTCKSTPQSWRYRSKSSVEGSLLSFSTLQRCTLEIPRTSAASR